MIQFADGQACRNFTDLHSDIIYFVEGLFNVFALNLP